MRTMVSLFLICSSFVALGQCVPNLSGPNFEAVPDTVSNLPTAYFSNSYEATIQMYIPTDTFVDMLNLLLPLDSLFIIGIDGLPVTFEYEVYPSAGPIPGGTPICLQITNPLVYEEVAGSHPLFIHVVAWSVGLPANGDITGYFLNVEPMAVGITEQESGVLQSNVITEVLTFNSSFGNELISIYNSLGQHVFMQKSKNSLVQLNVSFLPAGMYFLKSKSGVSKFLKTDG